MQIRDLLNRFSIRLHRKRALFFLIIDILLIALSMWAAFLIRFELQIPPKYLEDLWILILIALAVKVPIFYLQRLYHLSWSYVSIQELLSVLKGVLYSSFLLGTAFFILRPTLTGLTFPRSILVIDFFLTLFFIGGFRSAKRIWLQFAKRFPVEGRRTLIVGAGDDRSGYRLLHAKEMLRVLRPEGIILWYDYYISKP